MTHPLNAAIEMAINAADRSEEFKDLPGEGKPLAFLSRPKDAVIDRLMKENRALPMAVQLKKDVAALRERLKDEADLDARKLLMKQIAEQQLKLELELEAIKKYG